MCVERVMWDYFIVHTRMHNQLHLISCYPSMFEHSRIFFKKKKWGFLGSLLIIHDKKCGVVEWWAKFHFASIRILVFYVACIPCYYINVLALFNYLWLVVFILVGSPCISHGIVWDAVFQETRIKKHLRRSVCELFRWSNSNMVGNYNSEYL